PCPASLPSLSSVVSPTAPTEIYTLSLHDALPIWGFADQLSFFEVQHAWCTRWTLDRRVVSLHGDFYARFAGAVGLFMFNLDHQVDRKSTRLNSSHVSISYAVFCLKKKHITHETAT